MKWTQFMDMHSGGGQKLDWPYIYIEAPEKEAKIIFYNRFGRNSGRVTCTCCGSDYSVTESNSLADATGYERGCTYDEKLKKYVEKSNPEKSYRRYVPLDEFTKNKDFLFIYDKDIKDEERVGEVEEEGYVWQD